MSTTEKNENYAIFDPSTFFQHYFLLFRKQKYLIIPFILIIIIVNIFFIHHITQETPEIPVTAIVTIDPLVGKLITVPSAEEVASIHSAIIKSRHFLTDIIKEYSLQFRLIKFSRETLFDSLLIDSTARPGHYSFKIRKNHQFFICHHEGFFKKTILAEGPVAQIDSIKLQGIYLYLKRSFLFAPYGFSFYIDGIKTAVDHFHRDLSVNIPTRVKRKPIFGITLKGRDYKLITNIVNKVADKYIHKYIYFRQTQSRQKFIILENQLKRAQDDLAHTEDMLNQYCSKNKLNVLNQNTDQLITSLSTLEKSIVSIKENLKTSFQLQLRYSSEPLSDRIETGKEILAFLVIQKNIAAQVLERELYSLLNEQFRLSTKYASNHPQIIQNRETISFLLNKLSSILDTFINDQKRHLDESTEKLAKIHREIKMVPEIEMTIKDILRQEDVNLNTYSLVLNSYNQLMVDDAVTLAGVYVMEYAAEPIPLHPNFFQLVGACSIISFLVFILFVLLLANLNKTVYTEDELNHIFPSSPIECIPQIKYKNGKVEITRSTTYVEKEIWALLLTDDYKNEDIKELFRSLRYKISLKLQNKSKYLVCTSPDHSTGKSIIAANIAIAFAQHKMKVILLDFDIECGIVHKLFKVNKEEGISEFFEDYQNFQENDARALLKKTSYNNLHVVTSGKKSILGRNLFNIEKTLFLVNTLSKESDIVIFDTQPIDENSNILLLNNLNAQYLFILKAGATNIINFKNKIIKLKRFTDFSFEIILNFAEVTKDIS